MVVVINYIDSLYDDENERTREWKKLATNLGIEIVEDEALRKARHAREMAKVIADFGE